MMMGTLMEMVETVREVAKSQSFQVETSMKISDKEEIVEVEEDSVDEVGFEEGLVVIEVGDVVDLEVEGASEDKQFNQKQRKILNILYKIELSKSKIQRFFIIYHFLSKYKKNFTLALENK